MADDLDGDPATSDRVIPFRTRAERRRHLAAVAPVPDQALAAAAGAQHALDRLFDLERRQLQRDEALGVVYDSHVHFAHHALEPWARLTDSERALLLQRLPHELKDSPLVPPGVRVKAHSLTLDRDRKLSNPPSGPIAAAEWVLRQENGSVYGTGDPSTARSAVIHIVYPYGDLSEAEAYEALRGVLGENQVGILVVLPKHDKRLPVERQLDAVDDVFYAAAVEFPDTPLILSSHEGSRDTWVEAIKILRKERLNANVTGELTYIPVLSAIGGVGAQSKPITRMGVLKPVTVPEGRYAAARGNRGRMPGLS